MVYPTTNTPTLFSRPFWKVLSLLKTGSILKCCNALAFDFTQYLTRQTTCFKEVICKVFIDVCEIACNYIYKIILGLKIDITKLWKYWVSQNVLGVSQCTGCTKMYCRVSQNVLGVPKCNGCPKMYWVSQNDNICFSFRSLNFWNLF